MHYARLCREAGTLTSLDGGSLRGNTMELLPFIDVAVVSERFCEQLQLPPHETLALLKEKGCKVGGVTLGERGLLWFDEIGRISAMPALAVPDAEIVDTNGAGDVFHGAYVHSYLTHPGAPWEAHFRFARAASAHAVRYLGNEAKLPTPGDVEASAARYRPAMSA
jgi:sugar/nucleoside kinase (ribokinase family)